MKKLFILAFISTMLWSCDDASTADVSDITYYPDFEVLGDAVIFIPKGGTYTDPGVNVSEAGTEIEYTTSISGKYSGGRSVNTNVADIYTVSYNAVNQDGFSGTAGRTVIVYEDSDLVTGIEGLYLSTSNRDGALTAQYTNMQYVMITKNDDGTYKLSDGIGAYYDIGRAYGAGYASPVTITANNIPANNFTIDNPFPVGTFGGNTVLTDFTVNATAGTITFKSVWDAADDDPATGYTFAVTLTKVQF